MTTSDHVFVTEMSENVYGITVIGHELADKFDDYISNMDVGEVFITFNEQGAIFHIENSHEILASLVNSFIEMEDKE